MEQAHLFINDPLKNNIQEERVEISKIFSWFKGDFTKEQSLILFIDKYSDVSIAEKAQIDYLKYNWNLNDSK